MTTLDFAFWTPGQAPADDGHIIGCASHGFAASNTWREPAETAASAWAAPLSGEVVSGTYAAVLARLGQLAWKPAAAIVLFAHDAGMETFLDRWHALLPGVPVAGGGAARGTGQSRGVLLPAAEEVAVLLIATGAWRAESFNVHEPAGVGVECRTEGTRTITHLRETSAGDWHPASTFFRTQQTSTDRSAGDCESITFADTAGRNVHVSFDGQNLRTGADLPRDKRLVLRIVSRANAARRLAEFCAAPNALVFGCAGLRNLLDTPLAVGEGTLVGFMFGELVTLDDRPQFGNLMATRLVQERDP